MELLKHLQEIKQEIEAIHAHGDLMNKSFSCEVALEALEYHAEKAIRQEIRSQSDDET